MRPLMGLALALSAGPPVGAQHAADPTPPPGWPACSPRQAQVMLVGTYHMTGSSGDTYSDTAGDVLTPRRQTEVRALVEALARMRPTKIALEAGAGEQASLNEAYRAYLRGSHTLTSNERQQVGFRLARLLGHDSVYAVDAPMSIGNDSIGAFYARHPEIPQRYAWVVEAADRRVAAAKGRLGRGSIPEYLRWLNSEDALETEANGIMYGHIMAGEGSNYGGPEMLEKWYARNIGIAHHVTRLIRDEHERVLLLIGSGHVRPLRHLFTMAPQYCPVSPIPYLTTGAPDSLRLDSLLAAHSYPLVERDGQLAGPGASLLLNAAQQADFFVVAENHYRAEIPRITAMLFQGLHDRHGYQYLAVENGPYIMRRFSADGVRGASQPSFALAVRYPHALQFLSDEEIEMFVRVGRTSTAAGAPLWGLDRPFGASHILERLLPFAPDSLARERVAAMAAEAQRFEQNRSPDGSAPRWIVQGVDSASLAEVRRALHPAAGSPPDSMLSAIELSHRTYQAFLEAEAGAPTGYASNLEREEFMKAQLMAHLLAAQRAGEPGPRVLFKFGHWHAVRGMNWGDVFSLGDFVAATARSRGSTSFHLATALITLADGEASLGKDPAYAALTGAGDPNGWRVVDFRPLRPFVHAGAVAGLSAELRKWIFGFDAALLLGRSQPAHFERLMQ